jgi:hypothetical protein
LEGGQERKEGIYLGCRQDQEDLGANQTYKAQEIFEITKVKRKADTDFGQSKF